MADTWFDSGGMPFAQFGYPHQGVEEFERLFPADYICEAIDQTRGWFYTLLAESTLLFDRSSYDTVVCLGHIVDEDGAKMSKSRGNVLDPFDLIDRHGADALRWLMMAEGNPWVNRRVGHQNLEDVVRRFLLTLWNTHVFFLTYARIDGFALDTTPPPVAERPSSDRWVLAELADLVDAVDASLEGYDVSPRHTTARGVRRRPVQLVRAPQPPPVLEGRRGRPGRQGCRLPHPAHVPDDADRTAGAVHAVPGRPPVAGPRRQPGRRRRAVGAPDRLPGRPTTTGVTMTLRAAMATARRVTELGRQARNDSGVKIRQPLARALVTVPAAERDGLAGLVDEIADELNVREIQLTDAAVDLVDRSVKPNFRALGPAFQQDAPKVADAIRSLDADGRRGPGGAARATSARPR